MKASKANFKMFKQYAGKMMDLANVRFMCGTPPDGLSEKQKAETIAFVAAKGFRVTHLNSIALIAEKV